MQHNAKPFIKWAGGKKQLLSEIQTLIPESFRNTKFTYIEPFVGGGAVLFWILQKYPNIKGAIINDINTDLSNAYIAIKQNYEKLIKILEGIEEEFYSLGTDEKRKKEYYYLQRDLFNKRTSDGVAQAALFIFLNRTCFNGLYRVNRRNEFNVPMGNYKKPKICDKNNLRSVNRLLQKVEILNGDFEATLRFANKNTLFYLDPPYKPVSKTSSFTSYAKDGFDDKEQIRLANFCKKIDSLGCNWILSNSDVKTEDPSNDFFDNLYRSFHIKRVSARRAINSNPAKRGELTELLVTSQNLKTSASIA